MVYHHQPISIFLLRSSNCSSSYPLDLYHRSILSMLPWWRRNRSFCVNRNLLKRSSSSSASTSSSFNAGADGSAASSPPSVVITGGGPVGLALSALLSRFGVSNIVLEKNESLPDHPQAHFINCRTMEIFRHAFPPTLYKNLEAIIPPLPYWRHFAYQTSVVNGREIGRVDHFGNSDSDKESAATILAKNSPAHVAHLSQKRLQPYLFAAAVEAGAQVKLGCTVDGFEEGQDGKLQVVVKSGGEKKDVLPCDYLIAADGASSGIRQLAKVGMEGPSRLQHLMNIHFSSRELAEAIKHEPAMLHFIYNKDVVCVLVAHHFESGEFVAQVPFFPPAQIPEDFDEVTIQGMLRSAIGASFPDLVVHSARPWVMHCQVAERYRCGPGNRIILVGDSGHRFPPAGGFGMNTGIQDAYNLAWKLALVIGKQAKDKLLDSYQGERRPIAIANAELSMHNFERSLRVSQALGLDASQPKMMAEAMGRNPKPFFDLLLAGGRRPLAALEQVGQPYGNACVKAAQKVLQDGAALPLLFPIHDLGFCYPPTSDGPSLHLPSITSFSTNGLKTQPLQQLRVGGRMPHTILRLELTTANGVGEVHYVSTTDLTDQLHVAVAGDQAESLPFALVITTERSALRINRPKYLMMDAGDKLPIIEVEVSLGARDGQRQHQHQHQHTATTTTIAAALMHHDEAMRKQLSQHILQRGHLRMIDEFGQWRALIKRCRAKTEGEVFDAEDDDAVVLLRPDGHVWAIGETSVMQNIIYDGD